MEQQQNEKRKNIIKWLHDKIGTSLPVSELLNKYLFVDTNLIIQQDQQYAMYYLDVETFNDKEKKDDHIKQLLDVMTFLKFLSKSGHICIYQNNHFKNDELHYLGAFIRNPHQAKRRIILNDEGAYSMIPDCIQSADDEILFKGIKFDAAEYTLIKEHSIGNIFISKSFKELFDFSEIENEEEKEEEIQEEEQKEKPEEKKEEEPKKIQEIKKEQKQCQEKDIEDKSTKEKKEEKEDLDDVFLKAQNYKPKENMKEIIKETKKMKDNIPDMDILQEEKHISNDYRLLKIFLLLLLIISIFTMCIFHYIETKKLSNSTSKIIYTQEKIQQRLEKLEKPPVKKTKKQNIGIDMDRWKGEMIPENIYKSMDFVLLKATTGIAQVEKNFNENWQNLKKAKVLRGAYHTYIYADDPTMQAESFASAINDLDKNDIVPIIKLDKDLTIYNKNLDKKKLQIKLFLFLIRLEALTNQRPIIYVNEEFSDKYLKVIRLLGFRTLYKLYGDSKTKNFAIKQNTFFYNAKSDKKKYDVFYGNMKDLKGK